MRSTTSSPPAAIPAPPASIEPPEPKPSRPGPRSPAWPLGHKPSWDRPSCALSQPEPIKLTVPPALLHKRAPGALGGVGVLVPECDVIMDIITDRLHPSPVRRGV